MANSTAGQVFLKHFFTVVVANHVCLPRRQANPSRTIFQVNLATQRSTARLVTFTQNAGQLGPFQDNAPENH